MAHTCWVEPHNTAGSHRVDEEEVGGGLVGSSVGDHKVVLQDGALMKVEVVED